MKKGIVDWNIKVSLGIQTSKTWFEGKLLNNWIVNDKTIGYPAVV